MINNYESLSGIVIMGNAVVEDGAIIEGPCVIKGNSTIKKGAVLHPYCVIEDSIINDGCEIGPFARLRNNSIIENNCRIGNFVEIKNSHIKKGSKAAHLSYIGDAEVGENCNIGCGVIFCNYDGIHKHKTIVGDNCFIGSNVNLIAPLFIGNNCFIAAGTTLSDSIENNIFVRNSREIITHPNKFHK